MILKNISKIFRSELLKKRIYVTIGLIFVYKILSIIPVPWVDLIALESLQNGLDGQEGLKFFSALTWGGMYQFSIILMGLSPYINASIIIQLLAVVIPSLEILKKQGEMGQKKINQYTRFLTVPLAFVQSYGMILLLNQIAGASIINTGDFLGAVLPSMIIITAWTVLLLWLGELITEYGVGNGVSLVIFSGVLARVPGTISSHLSQENGLYISLFLFLLTLGVIYIIIKFTEGYRRIPLVYTRTGKDERSFFPIRINQAGMIPIIFAISLVTFPSIIGQILLSKGNGIFVKVGEFLTNFFGYNSSWMTSWWFIVLYFLLIVLFSFFYVSITFNTEDISDSIQKRWGYIPGVRPGTDTAEYLQTVSNRLNFFGGSFLAFIAIFPYVMNNINLLLKENGYVSFPGNNIDFIIRGSGLIIVVGVVLDIMRRIDADIKSYNYKKFY